MSYILKNPQEAQRLNEQSKNPLFDPDQEIKELNIKDATTVLDAGCGSGIFASGLCRHFPAAAVEGCDIDEDQLAFAKSNAQRKISFFKHDLVNQKFPKTYGHIVNRYVAHHFKEESYRKILANFHAALKPSGRLSIIDVDGVLSNIGTANNALLNYLEVFNASFGGDLKIARKIPSFLKELGFSDITWKIVAMDFKKENKAQELDQWRQRIEFGFQAYIDAFGNEFEARKFKKLFLEEIQKETVPVFYNKFFINCKKG